MADPPNRKCGWEIKGPERKLWAKHMYIIRLYWGMGDVWRKEACEGNYISNTILGDGMWCMS